MESGRRLDQEFADLLWDPPGGVILTRGLRSYRCFIFLRLNSIGDIGIRFIQICCNEQHILGNNLGGKVGIARSTGCRSTVMVFCLVTLIQVSHSSTLGSNDKDDSSSRRLLVSAQDEEFSMQKPQYISRPAGAPGMPLMKAAVNGAPVYFFQPSQMAAPSNLGTPPTYVIDPRILRKAQTNTLRARMSHAQNRAQSLSAAADDTTSILDVAVFVFVAIGGTLLVFIRIGIPSAFVK